MSKSLICPSCKTIREVQSHCLEPIRYGGSNPVSHYSCLQCGTMFVETSYNTVKECFNEKCINCQECSNSNLMNIGLIVKSV
jgi:hypothetical protein